MSGLKFLYNLILKDVVKGSGQASGIMSIGKDIRKLADKKFQRYVTSAQKQGVDLDKLSEQELKYTLELNKPKGQKIISADSPEGKGITEMLLGKRGKVIKADFGKPFAEEIVTVERVVTDIKKLEPIEAMKEANRVLKGEGRYKSLSKADREKIAMDESVTDHIFEREIKPDPEDMADGGRTGLSYLLAEDTNERVPFGAGGIDKVRRLFLQAIGAGAAGIGAVKSGLLGLGGRGTTKKVAQQVVKTPNAPGKPEWFDALITRVINEGDDVTKQFAYKERMKVHTKPISETEEVTVYRDLDDGSVRINYGSKLKIDETKPYERGNIQRASNDSDQVDLIVRQGEEIEPDLATGKGGGKTKASFEASEAEPRAAGGPEDADIEFDGIREVENVDDLMQDVSSLEEFATGKKLTGDKAAKAKKKREDYQRFTEDQVEQANYLEEKYGPYDDSAMDDFASGGRVPLFKGKIVKGIMSLGKKKKTSAVNEAYKKQRRRLEGYLGSLDRNAPDFQEAANITIKKLEKLERDYKAGKFVPEGQVIDDTIVVDDDFGSAMAEWARKNDPEGYAKIQKVVDEANQQLELKRFKTRGRKPNASGGLAKMLGE